MTIEEQENLRFRFGDLLEFCTRRFVELFESSVERYTPEYIRARVLRHVFPVLERYRFLRKIPPPQGEPISEEQTIYEALPAMYHYNSVYLHRHIDEIRLSVESTPATPNQLDSKAQTGSDDDSTHNNDDGGDA